MTDDVVLPFHLGATGSPDPTLLAGLKDPVTDAVFFTPGTKRDGFSPHVRGEQQAAGFVSKFDTGIWDGLYDGSEMAEFRRFAEQQRQERQPETEQA